jgi:hypothetical protein
MLKKASLGNSAAQIATAIVESNSLITYTTSDTHSIFEGAKVTVTGVTATTGVLPNVTNALVYKVNNATSFSVKPNSNFTYTGTFPATLAVGGDATVYSINGALMSSELLFAQPEKIIRPEYFNFISPEISLVASGNGVLVTWDALGVANPPATISVERILGTTSTVISTAATSVSTSASYVLDGSLTAGTTYTYRVTALNSILSQVATTSIVTLYINAISTLTAVAKPNTANTVSLSWSAPGTNAAISQYEIDRSSNGGSSWSALATTASSVFSYDDATATANGSTAYTYRIRAKAAYAAGAGGDIYSSYTSSSAISPFFISTATPTAATVASTANRLLVSWSAVSAAFPAVTSYELQRASSFNNSTFSEWSNLTLGSPTATSYSDTAATSAIYYKYRIRVLNGQLTSTYVESNSIQAFYLADPLSAPTVGRTSTTVTSLTVSGGSYTANPSITGYNIQRAISGTSPSYVSVGATNYSITLPYVDSTVATNTSYVYQVKAKNAELTTANWSAASTAITTYGRPSEPISFTAIPLTGGTSIALSWSAPVNNGSIVTSYTISRGATQSTATQIATTASNVTTFTDTGLTPTTAYTYTVFATNFVGTSPNAVVSASTIAGVPSAPVISVTGSSGGSLDNPAIYSVSWTTPANNGSAITGYVIESYGYSEVWQFYGSTTSTSGTFYADVGGDYGIRVYAVNAAGNGAVSNSVGISWYDANPPPPPRDD